MKVSVCITVYNEEDNIGGLIESLTPQLKRGDEIIIVDGGSTDDTRKILKKYAGKIKRLQVINEESTRAEGRNLSIRKAANDVIAITDAGCVAQDDWLENISEPFKQDSTDVVAGFYNMVADTAKQKSMANYLGVLDEEFDNDFLPSTRSVAFTKETWEKVGGFPEHLKDTAEDTVFNSSLVKKGMKIIRQKDARVEWAMPETIPEFFNKIKGYAKGDARSTIWYHDTKKLASHNIKALLVVLRYLLGFVLLITSIKYSQILPLLIIGLILYIFWSFDKNYNRSKSWQVGLWGISLQFISDIAVITGFISGTFSYILTKDE